MDWTVDSVLTTFFATLEFFLVGTVEYALIGLAISIFTDDLPRKDWPLYLLMSSYRLASRHCPKWLSAPCRYAASLCYMPIEGWILIFKGSAQPTRQQLIDAARALVAEEPKSKEEWGIIMSKLHDIFVRLNLDDTAHVHFSKRGCLLRTACDVVRALKDETSSPEQLDSRLLCINKEATVFLDMHPNRRELYLKEGVG